MAKTAYVKNLHPVEYNPFAQHVYQCVAATIEPQKEIFVSCLIGEKEANLAYNESISLEFTGPLDLSALKKALVDLIIRHEALRASFSADGSKICISQNAICNLDYKDLSTLNDDEQKQHLSEFTIKDTSSPFDLLNGPLFRTTLFKQAEEKHLLVITAHHIICDGWSFGIIIEDLAKLYSAYVKKEAIALEKAPRFCQYAVEQNEFLLSRKYQETEAYWLTLYKDGGIVFDIPTDYARPAKKTYNSSREDFSLDPALVSSFKKIGAKANCSLVVSLLSAFEILLHHISGQEQLVIGMPSAGQSINNKYGLVGHCVNFLPLRTTVDNRLSFVDYLKKRRTEVLNTFEHQQITLGSLLKKIHVERDPSRVTLTPTVFNIDMGMDAGVVFEGLKHILIHNKRQFEHFELSLNITGSGNNLTMQWTYNTDLYLPQTVNKWKDDFVQLLQLVTKKPEIKIGDVVLKNTRTVGQEEFSLHSYVKGSFPKNTPLHALIEKSAKQYSDKVAIAFGKKEVTYAELEKQSSQIAWYLLQQNISKGKRVAVALDRSIEMVISLVAIMKTGAAYVPIDPELPEARINYILEDAAVNVLLTSKKLKRKTIAINNQLFIEEICTNLSSYPEHLPNIAVQGNDLVYTLYTSGSTGKPKGVEVEHRNLVNTLCSAREIPGISEVDTILALTTISFDPAGIEMFLPLISGARILLLNNEDSKDPRVIIDSIESGRATIMQATPSMWQMLLDAGWQSSKSLKAISGGEHLSATLAENILSRCSELWNLYGPTEATIHCTAKKISRDEPITIGKAIHNQRIYILNKELTLVSAGVEGEIFIAGEGVARGYANRPELTAQRFLNDPFVPGERMYKTGDLGKFLSNGEIVCVGRTDNQVKIRGHRIELGEIEHWLIQHNSIERAVVAVDEEVIGSRLIAYVAASKKASKNKDSIISELRLFLKGKLPAYMIPNSFILLDAFPVTSNGKIDRKQLLKISALNHQVEATNAVLTVEQEAIKKIWQEVLRLDNIDIDKDFFELGGHSLTAVQMLSKLKKETGIYLPISVFFSSPTIAQMASLISEKNAEKVWKCLVPIQPNGSRPPLYLVHGASGSVPFFNKQVKALHPDQPIYGLQASGLNGQGEMHTSIEEMAGAYIREILQQNPKGPYMLGGYSLGGFIAFEMAQQLKALGKDVKMLAIFDTEAITSGNSTSLTNSFIEAIHYHFQKLFYTIKLCIEDPKSQYEYQRSLLKAFFRKPYYTYKNLLGSEKNYFYYKYLISKNSTKALKNYKLSHYDASIDLFKAKKKTYYMKDFEFLGWSKFVDKIRIHEIPGQHNKIFMPPYDEEFAEVLQRCINDALNRGTKISVNNSRYILRAI